MPSDRFLRLLLTSAALLVLLAFVRIATAQEAAADYWNCSHFARQSDAQIVLRADPSDPNGLDGDRDGVACETLP